MSTGILAHRCEPALQPLPPRLLMDDRAAFERLQSRWEQALAARRDRLVVRSGDQARIWAVRFESMAAQQAALQMEGRWVRGHGDLLWALGLDRAELIHSRALRWFLDPLGAHGLGGALLARLLDHLDLSVPPERELVQASLRREVPHPQGRADLIIDLPEARIVVENKIDAGEQLAQALRMVEAFDTDNTYFVFLTLDGAAPATAHGVQERWTSLSYRTVAGWLDELTTSDTGAGTLAARTYLHTIERIAGGTHRG